MIENPPKRLIAFIELNGKKYEIDCFYSLCKTKYHFYHADFGEAVFSRTNNEFLCSTRILPEDYFQKITMLAEDWGSRFAGAEAE